MVQKNAAGMLAVLFWGTVFTGCTVDVMDEYYEDKLVLPGRHGYLMKVSVPAISAMSLSMMKPVMKYVKTMESGKLSIVSTMP